VPLQPIDDDLQKVRNPMIGFAARENIDVTDDRREV
jgi:hypothetical protein